MRAGCRLGAGLALVLLLGGSVAAPPTAAVDPALARQLQAAVQSYESGRWEVAWRAFERLARQGLPAARYNLAVMHLRGELPAASPRRAEALMRQAAAEGFVTAQYALGESLEVGRFGPRDLVAAHDWYERAAQAGSAADRICRVEGSAARAFA